MKYNPFEIAENNDGERYGEITGLKFKLVDTISYGTDAGGDGFLLIKFDDDYFIRAEVKGQGRLEINTGKIGK